MQKDQPHRRNILQAGAVIATSGAISINVNAQNLEAGSSCEPGPLAGRIFKTLKIGMIGVSGSLTEKFTAAREAGFQGVEMNFPGDDVEAALKASKESGLVIDGSVNSTHWNVRHTDPSQATRDRALESLKRAIVETKEVGGHTVLLVVGHGNDGPVSEIWPRAIENISKALPLAAELGIYIAIENVWNHFLYVHNGPNDQKADDFVKFVDELNSPWVGMQFDIGNHWKYGEPGEWIRTLGKRIVKLDLKGFSRAEDKFTKIGEGDLPWKSVQQALVDIDFVGWAAAEVGGGNMNRLKEISRNMDMAFGLA